MNKIKSSFQINKSYNAQKIEGKMVIVDGDRSLLYTLNETGSYIYQCIKRGIKKEQIVQRIVEKYSVSESNAEQDYTSFCNKLVKKHILIST